MGCKLGSWVNGQEHLLCKHGMEIRFLVLMEKLSMRLHILLILTVVGRWAEAGRSQELTSYQIVSFQFGRRPCLKTIKQRAIGEDT